ncbi:GGDEF domain-containing protein [Loktanella sp. M215]|uniref:GGDEF domain-containing protein n=1 Tax=Loktanella sp. M215 TaxID=2675431 RepID=UPI001F262EFC|nr:GGDEF domain-containing protein [Loktanella sp. M215]MCF7699064.1 diguanylate cyclase [Loktanella sp. M215]
MIKIKTWWGVWASTLLLSSLIVGIVALQTGLENTPDIAAIVQPKAIIGAMLTSIPINFFLFYQIRKSTILAEKLKFLVERDRLTDVATRDYFYMAMDTYPEAYGVSLMVDIDHFKTINDRHGHLVGDYVIREVANTLRQIIREDDIVCRFGGEEFVIFLKASDADEGYTTAERMRRGIENTPLEAFSGEKVHVTVSIGCSMKDRLQDINDSIRAADAALYQAKSGGRNRTIFSAAIGRSVVLPDFQDAPGTLAISAVASGR